jgi:hypothetical protein
VGNGQGVAAYAGQVLHDLVNAAVRAGDEEVVALCSKPEQSGVFYLLDVGL